MISEYIKTTLHHFKAESDYNNIYYIIIKYNKWNHLLKIIKK